MLNNNATTNRAGIKPARIENVFTLKTSDAEDYITKKINSIPGFEDVVVNLFTLNLTDRFAPFVIALPMSVLKKKDKSSNKNGEVMSIFSTALDESDGKSKTLINDSIHKILTAYSFDAAFRQTNNEETMRTIKSQLGLSRAQCAMIDRTRFPHVESFSDGKIKCVMMTIDPIWVFTDMLGEPDKDNRQYRILVTGLRRIDESNTEYTVRRVPAKQEKGSTYTDISKEVVRRMMGRH